MGVHLDAVCIDCHDQARVAAFWAAVFERDVHGPDDSGDMWIELGAPFPGILFQTVPETKVVKNRLHMDLRPQDQAAEVARLERLGARRVDVGQGPDVSWVVLADPEGNEFCVLRALAK